MTKIHDLEDRIRDFINSGRRQSNLLRDSTTWNKLCSSLDLIGDTQTAIDAYPQLFSVKEQGVSYLIVYGIGSIGVTGRNRKKEQVVILTGGELTIYRDAQPELNASD